MSPGRQILFVTWDGPNSPYLRGLFLPIFAALGERGLGFHVLQFSWGRREERLRLARACEEAGISYRSVTIWRRPVAVGSLLTVLRGRGHVARAIRHTRADVVMPRSTLPALAAIPVARRSGLPVLLDADGLPHDERVEFGGASPNGFLYRMLRRLEAWTIRKSGAIAVRTRKAATILAHRSGVDEGRFLVVPNGRNSSLFRPPGDARRQERRSELGLGTDQPLLIYAGSSLSGKYRGEDMMRFFRQVQRRRAEARLLIVMPDLAEARSLVARHPDLVPNCLFRSAAPDEVPGWLGAADLGLALIHATFSMQAVSAIKVGEYLLCGVPVLGSKGVGDTEELARAGVGYWLENADDSSLEAAAGWFIETVVPQREMFRARCREAGLVHYSLDGAVAAYEAAVRRALSSQTGPGCNG